MKFNFPMIIGIILVILIVLLFLNGTSNNANGTYTSLEIRKLPNGNVLQRIVNESDGIWTREVKLLDNNGIVINTKSKDIDPSTCEKIKAGIFVRGLWSNDGALGCLSSSSS